MDPSNMEELTNAFESVYLLWEKITHKYENLVHSDRFSKLSTYGNNGFGNNVLQDDCIIICGCVHFIFNDMENIFRIITEVVEMSRNPLGLSDWSQIVNFFATKESGHQLYEENFKTTLLRLEIFFVETNLNYKQRFDPAPIAEIAKQITSHPKYDIMAFKERAFKLCDTLIRKRPTATPVKSPIQTNNSFPSSSNYPSTNNFSNAPNSREVPYTASSKSHTVHVSQPTSPTVPNTAQFLDSLLEQTSPEITFNPSSLQSPESSSSQSESSPPQMLVPINLNSNGISELVTPDKREARAKKFATTNTISTSLDSEAPPPAGSVATLPSTISSSSSSVRNGLEIPQLDRPLDAPPSGRSLPQRRHHSSSNHISRHSSTSSVKILSSTKPIRKGDFGNRTLTIVHTNGKRRKFNQ